MGGRYTEAQKAASIKYLAERTDDIRVRVPKGNKERYRQRAEELGKSLNRYIIDLIEKDIENGAD